MSLHIYLSLQLCRRSQHSYRSLIITEGLSKRQHSTIVAAVDQALGAATSKHHLKWDKQKETRLDFGSTGNTANRSRPWVSQQKRHSSAPPTRAVSCHAQPTQAFWAHVKPGRDAPSTPPDSDSDPLLASSPTSCLPPAVITPTTTPIKTLSTSDLQNLSTACLSLQPPLSCPTTFTSDNLFPPPHAKSQPPHSISELTPDLLRCLAYDSSTMHNWLMRNDNNDGNGDTGGALTLEEEIIRRMGGRIVKTQTEGKDVLMGIKQDLKKWLLEQDQQGVLIPALVKPMDTTIDIYTRAGNDEEEKVGRYRQGGECVGTQATPSDSESGSSEQYPGNDDDGANDSNLAHHNIENSSTSSDNSFAPHTPSNSPFSKTTPSDSEIGTTCLPLSSSPPSSNPQNPSPPLFTHKLTSPSISPNSTVLYRSRHPAI
ncbi:hypothetical protein EV426DRAFT_706473 [Tirmania nivea]|nr:hypothetical protein EV426DRAFT_706473 [Tirmania nivea]